MKNNGYVLLIVLIFLQLITLLGLFGLETCAIELKMNGQIYERLQLSQLAKQALSLLEDTVEYSSCIIPQTDWIDRRSGEWWLQYACSDNLSGFRYYYVIEKLGNDPCGLIGNVNNQSVSANYYRTTLRALPTDKKAPALMLQSVVAKPNDDVHNICLYATHHVKEGRQTLREL